MTGIDQANAIPSIDKLKFNQLNDIIGDGICEIIDVFTRTAPNSLKIIAASLQSGDTNKVFIEAHTLKSSSGNIGLSRFSRLCEILEAQARENDIQEAAAQLQLLNDEFLTCLDALNGMLGQYKT